MMRIIFLFFIVLQGCRGPQLPDPITVQPIETISIDVEEPSGLMPLPNGDAFLVVSDQKNKVYHIDLMGSISKKLDYKGEDIEGVTRLPDGSIWIVEEGTNELVHLDKDGKLINRISIPIIQEEPNHGLEGITYNETAQEFYLIAEKNPARLIRLDKNGTIIEQFTLGFAKDYSGIDYSSIEDVLYIVSDQSQLFAKCDLSGIPQQIYHMDIVKAEGIAVDELRKRVFIVSDQTRELYKFDLE